MIIIEIRNEAAMKVTFSAFEYHSCRFLWRDRTLQEPWWVTLLEEHDGRLYFQVYEDIQNPERKSLLAANLYDMVVLWQRDNFSVQAFVAGGILGGGEGQDDLIILDVVTGLPISAHTTKEMRENKISSVRSPFQYMDGNAYFNSIKAFLLKYFGVQAEASAEYVEDGGLIFLSYYVRKGAGLSNHLLVATTEGEAVLHEVIATDLKGVGVDTFFLLSDCLFTVKDKRELITYQLR